MRVEFVRGAVWSRVVRVCVSVVAVVVALLVAWWCVCARGRVHAAVWVTVRCWRVCSCCVWSGVWALCVVRCAVASPCRCSCGGVVGGCGWWWSRWWVWWWRLVVVVRSACWSVACARCLLVAVRLCVRSAARCQCARFGPCRVAALRCAAVPRGPLSDGRCWCLGGRVRSFSVRGLWACVARERRD